MLNCEDSQKVRPWKLLEVLHCEHVHHFAFEIFALVKEVLHYLRETQGLLEFGLEFCIQFNFFRLLNEFIREFSQFEELLNDPQLLCAIFQSRQFRPQFVGEGDIAKIHKFEHYFGILIIYIFNIEVLIVALLSKGEDAAVDHDGGHNHGLLPGLEDFVRQLKSEQILNAGDQSDMFLLLIQYLFSYYLCQFMLVHLTLLIDDQLLED